VSKQRNIVLLQIP